MEKLIIYRYDSSNDPRSIAPERIDEIWNLLSSHIPEGDKPREVKGKRVIPCKWLGRIRGNEPTLHDIRHMELYFRGIIENALDLWTNNPPRIFPHGPGVRDANEGHREAVLSTIGLAERILNEYLGDFVNHAVNAEEFIPTSYSEN